MTLRLFTSIKVLGTTHGEGNIKVTLRKKSDFQTETRWKKWYTTSWIWPFSLMAGLQSV